ncbi:MAG: hypothetical protein ACOCXZ_02500, partial [Chloroflexota bacterium]
MANTPENAEETRADSEEKSTFNVFVTEGTVPVARAVNRRLVQAGHTVTALTDGREGAAMIRKDGGLPVFADTARASEVRAMMEMARTEIVIHIAPQ